VLGDSDSHGASKVLIRNGVPSCSYCSFTAKTNTQVRLLALTNLAAVALLLPPCPAALSSPSENQP
jgi:hypothetical protein